MIKSFRPLFVLFFLINFAIYSYSKDYDLGDQKSSTLTTKAWAAFQVKDWQGVDVYTDKCIAMYANEAQKQQSQLTALPPESVAFNYWALNDVATSFYIKAKANVLKNEAEPAKKNCETIINLYSYAQCWDNQGWFWSVSNASKDMLATLGSNIDFGDYTSQTLVAKAWEALNKSKERDAIVYANKCIALYKADADKQQKSLSTYPAKDKVFDYWALNDVGTSYFVLGDSYVGLSQWNEALNSYQTLINDYGYAQCWDPKGWFWKPSVSARGKVNKIKSEQKIN
ncbi:MAG: Beta-glucanase [uncultured bacterium]|nr:MAG: Beta-glucanase [uncultured bacterium]